MHQFARAGHVASVYEAVPDGWSIEIIPDNECLNRELSW